MTVRLGMMLLIDAVLAILALYTAVTFCFVSDQLAEPYLWRQCQQWGWEEFVRLSTFFTGCVLMASYIMEVYTLDRRCSKLETFIKSFQAGAVGLFLVIVAFYFDPSPILTKELLLLGIGFFFLYQYLWHAFSIVAIRSPHFCQRVLILGTGQLARQLGDVITSGDTGFTLAGYLTCADEGEESSRGIPRDLLVNIKGDLLAKARVGDAGMIVVAVSEKRGVLPLQELIQCKLEGVKVIDAPTFYEMVQEKLLLEEITPSWIVFSTGFNKSRLYLVLKRCCDITLSLAALLLVAPLIPFIALAIKLDSRGPVLFKQVRVGSEERMFTLYKFRSMKEDAEHDGAVWAAQNDSRVTGVGRFLRKYRIDEIPQLYNVLKGDMSFIGPRPERPEFVRSLKEEIYYYSKRHILKPGLTGWAQVRYPYGATVQDAVEKLRYDLYYIKNHSLLLDFRIIFETIKVVVFGTGSR